MARPAHLLLCITVCATVSHAQTGNSAPRRMTLDATPSVSITDDGTPEHQFTRIAARRLSNGAFVIGDLDAFEVRLFDERGTYLRRLASRGKGPGEVPGPYNLVVSNDTIFLFGIPPFAPANVQVYSAAGYISALPPLMDNGFTIQVMDRLANGRLLVTRGTSGRVLSTPPVVGQLVADSTRFGVRDGRSDVSSVVWLPSVVSQWMVGHPWPRGRLPSTLSTYVNRPASIVAASSNRLWIVHSENGVVEIRDDTGREIKTVRLPGSTGPFDRTQLNVRRSRAYRRATRALDSARADVMADPAILPKQMPYVSSATPGIDGEIWLTRFSIDETAPKQMLVLSRDGTAIGELSIPPGLEIHQIGKDFVLGIRRDDDGLVSVVMHRLLR